MSSETRNSIINLEKDYASHKEKFEKWKEENLAVSGHASYNNYVDQFLNWEKSVMEQLAEQKRRLKSEMTAQSATQINDAKQHRPTISLPSQIPMVDMDTQVNEMLQKVTPAEFMVAVFSMAQTDPNFLPKVFEVVHRESKGTGFFNPIMPSSLQKATLSLSQATSLPYHHTNNYPHRQVAPSTSYYPNFSAPPPTLTTSTATVGYNNFCPGSLLTGPTANNYYRPRVPLMGYDPSFPPPRLYSQPQPQIYGGGPVPEGWTVQPAIIKGHRISSPKRLSGANISLPFKDFSQMSSEKSLLD